MFEPDTDIIEPIEDEELSYGEILSSAILNGEIVITIPIEDEERVKNGLKNYKSKLAVKQKEEGQPVDPSTLIFSTTYSKEFPGCIDLSIQNKLRGTVKVKRLFVPVNDLPS